jgi:hypothetical protein
MSRVGVVDSRRDIGFIGHFNTQLVITFKYSAIADFHTFPNHAVFFQPVVASLCQIFWEVVGLEQGTLSFVKITEKLFQGNSGPGLKKRN